MHGGGPPLRQCDHCIPPFRSWCAGTIGAATASGQDHMTNGYESLSKVGCRERPAFLSLRPLESFIPCNIRRSPPVYRLNKPLAHLRARTDVPVSFWFSADRIPISIVDLGCLFFFFFFGICLLPKALSTHLESRRRLGDQQMRHTGDVCILSYRHDYCSLLYLAQRSHRFTCLPSNFPPALVSFLPTREMSRKKKRGVGS